MSYRLGVTDQDFYGDVDRESNGTTGDPKFSSDQGGGEYGIQYS